MIITDCRSRVAWLPLVLAICFAPTPSNSQIKDLSASEKANADLVTANLKKLVTEGEATLPPNPTTPADQAQKEAAQKELNKLREVQKNLSDKVSGGHIKSVPGLKKGTPKKYKHDDEKPNSPHAAYCDDETRIKDGNKWVLCKEGDIVVDSDDLDPRAGTNIDENTTAGWKQKWALLHILVHEKMHEIMINEQIDLLKKQAWWPDKPDAEKEELIKKAKEAGSTAEKQQQVYMWQKAAINWERHNLEVELKRLSTVRPPDQAAINALQKKIDWLRTEHANLETKMQKATGGKDFRLAYCAIPGLDWNDLTRVYVAADGLYWRLDVVRKSESISMRIGETGWLGEVTGENPITGQPKAIVVLREAVFSAISIQPNKCDYVDEAQKEGIFHVARSAEEANGWLQRLTGVHWQATK